MKRHLQSAADIDVALTERRALEEVAAVADRYIPQLPADSPMRSALSRLMEQAPPDRQQAA